MRIPEETMRRACEALGDNQAEDTATRDLAERVLLNVIPSIRAYERARIAEVIRPDDLDELGHMINLSDKTKRQLQLWARVLRATSGSPAAMLLEELPT